MLDRLFLLSPIQNQKSIATVKTAGIDCRIRRFLPPFSQGLAIVGDGVPDVPPLGFHYSLFIFHHSLFITSFCRGGIVPPALALTLTLFRKEGADRSRRVF
jgi:hypothetical protein